VHLNHCSRVENRRHFSQGVRVTCWFDNFCSSDDVTGVIANSHEHALNLHGRAVKVRTANLVTLEVSVGGDHLIDDVPNAWISQFSKFLHSAWSVGENHFAKFLVRIRVQPIVILELSFRVEVERVPSE
jgi:hypothetical protein